MLLLKQEESRFSQGLLFWEAAVYYKWESFHCRLAWPRSDLSKAHKGRPCKRGFTQNLLNLHTSGVNFKKKYAYIYIFCHLLWIIPISPKGYLVISNSFILQNTCWLKFTKMYMNLKYFTVYGDISTIIHSVESATHLIFSISLKTWLTPDPWLIKIKAEAEDMVLSFWNAVGTRVEWQWAGGLQEH